MIDSRILIALISMLIAISSVVWVGINEADRRATFTDAFAGRAIEGGGLIFEETCSPCHGIKGLGIQGVAPVLNNTNFFYQRLDEIGYQASLEAYLKLTISGGRPVKSLNPDGNPWPQNMPAWGVDYGGPMRNDQIDSVVAYIMHWQDFVPKPGEEAPTPTPLDCATPAECGELLFQNQGCIGCHTVNGAGGAVGPELTNLYADKGEDYVRKSILNPNADIAEGFLPNLMPPTFGQTLSEEDLTSIIAYLASVSQ